MLHTDVSGMALCKWCFTRIALFKSAVGLLGLSVRQARVSEINSRQLGLGTRREIHAPGPSDEP